MILATILKHLADIDESLTIHYTSPASQLLPLQQPKLKYEVLLFRHDNNQLTLLHRLCFCI